LFRIELPSLAPDPDFLCKANRRRDGRLARLLEVCSDLDRRSGGKKKGFHLTRVDHGIAGSKTKRDEFVEDGEFTFADVLGFLRRNWRFLGLLTLVLSAVAVALVLLLPKQYQKEVTLQTGLAPSRLLVATEGGPMLPLPTRDQISNSAVSTLQSGGFEGVEVKATYDAPTQQIKAVLSSGDDVSLAGATPELVSFLEEDLREKHEGDITDTVELQLMESERQVESMRQAIDRAETREEGDDEDQLTSAFIRARLIGDLDAAESNLEVLEQVWEALPQLIAETISVEVLSESGVQQSRATAALVLLGVVASFAAAVALTLAREALARRK
jgi:hypothetical protein